MHAQETFAIFHDILQMLYLSQELLIDLQCFFLEKALCNYRAVDRIPYSWYQVL